MHKGRDFPAFFMGAVKCFTKTQTVCGKTLHAMTPQGTIHAESSYSGRIDDLFKLTLADGLQTESGGKELRYKLVKLRETTVADERRAERESERAVNVNGAWKLLVSESTFKHVLNMLHIEEFVCDGQAIPQAMIDIDLYDRLSSRDLKAIEERIFLITLSSEVRYGNMTEQEFDAIAMGLAPAMPAQSPQSSGQTPDLGAPADQSGAGPAMLADFIRNDSEGPAQGHGQANQ